MGATAQTEKQENMVVRYFKEFKVLKEVKNEYWHLQVINALDSFAYFAMFNILTLTLSADFGFNDENAGYIVALFASTTTACLFFSGLLTDTFGIKKSLYIAVFGLMTMRISIVFAAYLPESDIRNYIVIGAMFLMAPFMALIQTTYQAANKRFTTKKSRGAGFNLWYLFMNLGAFGGGLIVDLFFLKLGLPRFQIFSFGIAMSLLCLIPLILGIKNIEQAVGEDEEPEEEPATDSDEPKGFAKVLHIIKSVGSEPVFWRFTALVTLLLGVRMVFLYLGLLHPKYWERVIGPDVAMGLLQAINPALIFIGLVLIIPILNKFNVFKMLVIGAFITSLSMFICAVPHYGIFAGIDIVTFTYATSIAFLVVLTFGELIWSPRLQEYTAAIAPKGQEGTYMGLSMVPYFLAKTVLALISGHMLARWCPAFEEGTPIMGERIAAGQIAFVDSPYMMFTVLACVAIGGTTIAWLLRGWFTKGMKF